jgi:hypothetical protein
MTASAIGLPPDNQPNATDLVYLKNLGNGVGGWCPFSVIAGAGFDSAALALNATTGFSYMPTCAGTPVGVPTAYTGRVAFVFDTTANKIWVYDGAWIATPALT